MADTIAAVVVTFNRRTLLTECLDALLCGTHQLDKIILIDNGSTDNTTALLQEKGYLDNPQIDYIRLSENTGGAGGFYEGVKRGHEAGYDWLWLMDDDAEPTKDALEKLSKHLSEPDVSALANLKVDQSGKILSTHLGFSDARKDFDFESAISRHVEDKAIKEFKTLEITFTSFVGLLVSRKAIDKIGFPKKELFIHFDDVEYCIRLISVGRILLVNDSIILHKDAAFNKGSVEKKLLGKVFYRAAYEKLWLGYYGTRNLVWLRKIQFPIVAFYVKLFENYFRSVGAILLFDDNKFKRIRFLTEAYRDGLEGNFDNTKPKSILYGKF